MLGEDAASPFGCVFKDSKDRYALSWQIVPKVLPELLNDPDPETSQRVTQALLQMKKLDIAELQRAAAGS